MKLLILITLFVITPIISIAQWDNPSIYNFNFEDTTHTTYMYRDTITNPDCIWQVGEPQKDIFVDSHLSDNAILTDTINSYPINDTSSFIIKHEVGSGYFMGHEPAVVLLSGYYLVDSDTLNDFGKIEFSPNNGIDWVLISNDTTANVATANNTWPTISTFALTGSVVDWTYFEINIIRGLGELYTFSAGDTVQYRFTFISDAIYDDKDGLMFDDIVITDLHGGGLNNDKADGVMSFPNPFNSSVTIKPQANAHSFLLYDINGRLVFNKNVNQKKTITINTTSYKPGVYLVVQKDKNGAIINSEKLVK